MQIYVHLVADLFKHADDRAVDGQACCLPIVVAAAAASAPVSAVPVVAATSSPASASAAPAAASPPPAPPASLVLHVSRNFYLGHSTYRQCCAQNRVFVF
jgi:hypothetical protein